MRQRLIAATLACIDERGLAATTMGSVAAEAGCSRATLYRHFGSRTELLEAAIAGESDAMAAAVDEAMREVGDDGSIVDRVAAGVENLAGQYRTRFVFGGVDAAVAIDALKRTVGPYLAVAADRGELRAGVDVASAADYVSRMMLAYAADGRCEAPSWRSLAENELVGSLVATYRQRS